MDPSWRRALRGRAADGSARVGQGTRAGDASGAPADSSPESWEQISPQAVNGGPMYLPLGGDIAGPSVLRAQVLLDRVAFSPGIIDGRWGKNTEKAIYWFQEREGLDPTGTVDRATYDRLRELAGSPGQLVREHRLTSGEVSGNFVTIPEDIYAKADMPCMCYESLAEKLSELFHSSPELLRQLNPGTDLNSLAAGDVLRVPNVRGQALTVDTAQATPGGPQVARVVISKGGFYLHALDSSGRILYHFPTTVGSEYSPSPTGRYQINSVHPSPTWHYQPDILHDVPNDKPDAVIPPGPNNAVGVVWMDLSEPTYGIHGTAAPATIGYTTSHGCVRLTNWDATYLANRVEGGTPVQFRDTD